MTTNHGGETASAMPSLPALYRERRGGLTDREGFAFRNGVGDWYYRAYQKLMNHWHTVLPGAVYDLEYERLIAEPTSVIGELLDYCRLPWEDGCLAFYRTTGGEHCQRIAGTPADL